MRFAMGGGFFFINDGILRFFTDLAKRDAPNDRRDSTSDSSGIWVRSWATKWRT